MRSKKQVLTKSIAAIIISIITVLPLLPAALVSASAEIDVPDRMRDSFPDVSVLDRNTIYEDKSAVGNWSYQFAPADSNNYSDLNALFFSARYSDLPWQYTMKTGLVKVSEGYDFNWNHPIISNRRAWLIGDHDSVYTYTAPADGIIDISFPEGVRVYGNVSNSVGVKLVVYKKTGNKYIPIGPANKGAGIYGNYETGGAGITDQGGGNYFRNHSIDTFTTAVKAGETLHFQISKNITVSGYNVSWDPCVTYTGFDYDASKDLGITMDVELIDTYAFQGGTFANYNADTGSNGWLYQSYVNGSYVNLTNYTEGNWTIGNLWGGHPGISNGIINPGSQYQASATYTAPAEGILELPIDMARLFADPPPPDDHNPATGVLIAIFQNETKIWPDGSDWFLAERGPTGYSFMALENIAVKAGDKLHFRAQIYAGRPNHAGLRWDPHVRYTSCEYDEKLDLELKALSGPETYYDYVDGFSNRQGPIWYYLSVPVGGTAYEQLEYVTTDWGFSAWANSDSLFSRGFIRETEMLPGYNHDAVVAFKAPYTGQITLSSRSGQVRLSDSTGVSDGSTPSDGVDFGIFLRSMGNLTKLYPSGAGTPNSGMEYIENGGSRTVAPITLNIKKNEVIWIRVNNGANGRNDHDSVNFQPIIEYLELDENDPGVPDEDSAGGQRADRPAGSNLRLNEFPVAGRIFGGTTQVLTPVNNGTVLARFEAGELAPGVYEIGGNRSFVIAGVSDKTLDFTGYKFIVTPNASTSGEPERRFGLFLANCRNVTVKNLTIEVRGTPNEVVHGWDNMNITLQNLEVIDGNNTGPLMSFGDNAENITIDGLRYAAGTGRTMKSFIWLGAENRNITIKNSYIKDARIEAETKGVWIENNIVENTDQTGIVLNSNGTAIYNTVNITGGGAGINGAGNKVNVLAALNKITGDNSIDFSGVKNGVILLNELARIYAYGGTNITIAENTFPAAGGSLHLENINYALGANNRNFPANATLTGSGSLSGDDFYPNAILPEAGANEDLIPKLNKELFVGMERKSAVNYGAGNTATLSNYISMQYGGSKYVIIPPGAYSSNTINLSGYSDYRIYAYGVLSELSSYTAAILMNNCEDITVRGMYVDHTVPANGQATITGVTGSTITFKMDEGYNQNLLSSSQYALSGGSAPNVQWYRQGEKLVSNIATSAVTAVNAAEGIFSMARNNFSSAQVGDKLGFRGRDVQTTRFENCSNMRLEDYTIYGSGGFGFVESGGNKSTTLYRMAGVPGPAPVLPDGRRGPDRLISTCDSTHSINMRGGPRILNCLFESATDDGTNIRADFGTVLSFDSATRTVTYTRGNNYYSGLCRDFQVGDRVLIYTKDGELLCDATAVSATGTSGGNRTVRIDGNGNFEIKNNGSGVNMTVIQNASATGNNFLIKNTRLYGNWTKGFLIKAIDGEISNCTMDSVGITAIYLCAEIRGELWSECGNPENILIKNNLIKNTGYMYSTQMYSTVINITNDASLTNNPDFMMIKDIVITGNIIQNRHTRYALQINGGNKILAENNDWGFMAGRSAADDMQTPAIIATSKDIEMNDNKYPPLAVPKINISQISTINIFGTDISAPIDKFIKAGIGLEYNGKSWEAVVSLENISNDAQSGTVDISQMFPADLNVDTGTRTYVLGAGESAKIRYAVTDIPVTLKSAKIVVLYTLDGDRPMNGMLDGTLYFNAAVKTDDVVSVDDIEDAVWKRAKELKTYYPANSDYNTVIRFLYDDDYLYLLAEVADPSHSQPIIGGDSWNGDGIQFAIDPGRGTGIPGQLEIGFALSDNDVLTMWCWGNSISGYTGDLAGRGFDAVIKRNDNINLTTYKIAMPWSFIGTNGQPPEDGSIVAFNVCINNRDQGSTVRTYYEYYGGIAADKNAAEFGLMHMYAPKIALVSATPAAYVDKITGSKNDLTVTVTELYSDGSMNVITETFTINNNAAGVYDVGGYKVYVDTKGNTQIRKIYIIE